MQNVLSKASKTDVRIEPFPYLLVENAVSEDLADALIKEFPSNQVVAQDKPLGDNMRFSLSAPLVTSSQNISKTWKDFIAVHSSQEFLDIFFELFKDPIKKEYPELLSRKQTAGIRNKDTYSNADVLLDAQICINSPVLEKPSSVKIAHIDDTDKLYAGLFYLRSPDDDSEGGNLEIYKTVNGKYVIHGQRLVDNKYVEKVLTIPYKKNTLIIFLNSPQALHGVTLRSKTSHTRKFMNLIAEVRSPLFNLDQFKENFFQKVSRKLTH